MSGQIPPEMTDWSGGAKYEVRGTLGQGAMGVVLDGFDRAIERRVAIKIVRKPPADDAEGQEAAARFKREAQAAGRLSHPHIVGVYDYGEDARIAWIVMEMVTGGSLKNILDRDERIPLREVVRLTGEVLDALSYAHARGIVHRDIKPANVMLSEEGRAKLADFGIARIENSAMTQAGTLMGTPSYMAPEQFRGEPVDARADIWATGVMLYQLLTGEKPFSGGLSAVMHKVLNTEPPPPSALSSQTPRALDAVVLRALAKRPDERWADAKSFAAAIVASMELPVAAGPAPAPMPVDLPMDLRVDPDDATVVSGPPPIVPRGDTAPTPPRPEPARPGRPGWLLPIAGGGGLAIAGIVGAFLLWPATQPPTPTTTTTLDLQPLDRSAEDRAAAERAAADAAQRAAAERAANERIAAEREATDNAAQRDAAQRAANERMTGDAAAQRAAAERAAAERAAADAAATQRAAAERAAAERAAAERAAAERAAAERAAADAAAQRAAAERAAAERAAAERAAAERAAAERAAADAAAQRAAAERAAAERAAAEQAAARQAEAMRGALAAATAAAPCGLLATRNGPSGIEIQGVIPRSELPRLRAALAERNLPSGSARLDLEAFEGPYCSVFPVFRTALAEPGAPPRIALDGPSPLRGGQFIRMNIEMPDWATHLHIAFLGGDGSVHVMERAAVHPRGARVRFGDPRPDFPGWEVSKPFGTDLLVVIVSEGPIFPLDLPEEPTQAAYAGAVTAAVEGARRSNRRVALRPLVVETAP
ncbi:serine/threonine-protein kinase [Roseomonas sp. CCTCC AB2023176]|uniref:serine/threonine-protein kinase n=1 Tax=Roseomonas sp. CCTCC AB2023176 TaxID=3342640 RepID=UPI0035D8C322